MKVQFHATPPPRHPRPRAQKYRDLIAALAVTDGWVSVSASDVTGLTLARKQIYMHATCKHAGVAVRTRTSDGMIFIQKKEKAEAMAA
jgi:hypothetical protein